MNDEAEMVRRAADALTLVYGPQWPSWVKLWKLNMLSMHRCVLAQVETGSGLSPLPPGRYRDNPFSRGIRRLYQVGVTTGGVTTGGFTVSPGESVRSRRAAWKREIRKRRNV